MVRKYLATTAILCTLGLGTAVAAACTPVSFEYRYMVAPAFAAGAAKACIHQAKRLAKFELASVAAPQQLALK